MSDNKNPNTYTFDSYNTTLISFHSNNMFPVLEMQEHMVPSKRQMSV